MNSLETLIHAARHPVVLTGAGISAPSGIPTFQGMWKGRPIRDYLSRECFEHNPVGFFELFSDMVLWCEKLPNPAHIKLAEWDVPIITQNIDGLHQKAGSKEVYEMHGSLRCVICPNCGKTISSAPFAKKLREMYQKKQSAGIRSMLTCSCGAQLDTDIVLYGDAVRHLDHACELASGCDVMLVIGSSLITYPAAALPDRACRAGAKVIMINDDCVTRLTGDN